MGGHKRKSSDRDKDYEKKRLREMEKKLEKREQRINNDKENDNGGAQNGKLETPGSTVNATPKNPEERETPVIDLSNENETGETSQETQSASGVTETLDLDPEILKIIGETPASEPEGLKLSSHISNRWKMWLKTGQTKETKELLLKKYPRKGECSLEAPKLNPEIAASLNDGSLKRDKYFSNTQNLAGSALSALSLVIDPLLTKKREEIDIKKMLENLWESSQILIELYRGQTIARKACILPSLNKQTAALLGKTETGELLFGDKLGEKIKESKVIDKIGTDIKSQQSSKKPGAPTSHLNVKSPSVPRYQAQAGTKPKPSKPSYNQKYSSQSKGPQSHHRGQNSKNRSRY
ncbi:uncharacterized protein LOC124301352 [Neodiprion virginianus]|uniref:uncharacterized protein LOC124301352 n=2 Tax=Neodiprion virginianus TaxID=2961670 RepID=UPI001EE69461|nr:uncharacterized protein LOC124301352 [Neodiprion virginianus]